MSNKGSEWRKWDLHIHTPKTLCSEYGGDTEEIWDKFIDELERLSIEKEIKVIGINDYLFIDGYKRVLEYKASGRLSNIDLILPVIEFRLKEFVGSSELGRLNYHIIFADTTLLSIDKIETHFLSGFKGKANLDTSCPEKYTWGGVITRESLIDLGNHIIENTPVDKRTSSKPIDIGFNNINFELSKIEELLGEGSEPNTFLQSKYFKAIGKAEWEDFRWDSSPLEKKNIINKAHFVFSASPTVEKANSGKTALKKSKVNSRLLHCSDAHSFAVDPNNTKPKELGHCSTWIKAQPTFEGLKQIIFEPDERVIIQKELPESDKLDNLMVDKVVFYSSNNKFNPKEINFNKNLNVIIGGKSSGKSILLYNIAKTLYENPNNSLLKYKDSDDDFKEKDLYNLSIDDPSFDFSVQNFLKISQSIKRQNGQASILPSIKYIPQNHLSNLVDKSKKNSSVLKEYIRNLILEDSNSQKEYNDFVEKVKGNDKVRSSDLSTYFTYKEELRKKQVELQQRGDKEAIKKTIEALEGKIKDISKQMSDEQTTEYTDLNREYTENEQFKNSLLNDYEKIKNFLISSENVLTELKAKKSLLLENFDLGIIKTEFDSKLAFIDAAIGENGKLINLFEKNEEGHFLKPDQNIFHENLVKTEDKLNELKTKLEPFNKLFENQRQVEGFQKTISQEKVKLAEIEQIEKEIKNVEEIANKRKEKVFDDIKENRLAYTEIIDKLKPRIDSIKNEDPELDIQSEILFNFSKYRKSVLEISHGNSRSYDNYEILKEVRKTLEKYDFERYMADLKAIFKDIEEGRYAILKKHF